MYNKVKALESNGKSHRAIAKELNINRRTVKKFVNMNISEAQEHFNRGVQRSSGFDVARDFIEERLTTYPDIRKSNLYHQVLDRYPDITLKERAFRLYANKVKQSLNLSEGNNQRYFKPVTSWETGKYMQVDAGEKSVSLVCGGRMKLYFLSFVLCHSRAMYIHYSTKAYNTDMFIDAHLSAFMHFGGIPAVGIYDQTKLVSIREEYREVVYNKRFQKFFLQLGFQVYVCEGYDPESKGMVENSIGYIKNSFLYGREFSSIEDVRCQSAHWLTKVANDRIHQATLRKPSEVLLEEQPFLKTHDLNLYACSVRKVDKTGFISFNGCLYSVPFRFQGKEVLVRLCEKMLYVYDPANNDLVAVWDTDRYHNRINANDKHYLNYKTSIEEEISLSRTALEQACIPKAEELLVRIREDNNKHQRAQYQGIRRIVKRFELSIWEASIDSILSLPLVTCSKISNLLKIRQNQQESKRVVKSLPSPQDTILQKNNHRSLDYYESFFGGVK